MSEASSRDDAARAAIKYGWSVPPVASSRDAADGPCVAESCVNLPIGKTKHGWCPFCGDCLREMLIPLRPTETDRTGRTLPADTPMTHTKDGGVWRSTETPQREA